MKRGSEVRQAGLGGGQGTDVGSLGRFGGRHASPRLPSSFTGFLSQRAWGWLAVGSEEMPEPPLAPHAPAPRPPPAPDAAVPLGAEPSSPRGSWAFSVSLGELKSIRRSKPGLSWAYLVLVTQAGGSLPALHFHRGGTRALLRVLSRYLLLAR